MTTTESVVIVRMFAATPERLFKAWTTPDALMKWFVSKESERTIEADMDVRPGGDFNILMGDPEDRYHAFGQYKRVEPPTLLEFTWQWEESSIEKGISLVTLEFRPDGAQTEMTLTHARLASDVSVQAHTEGWTAIVGRLADFIAQEQN